MIKNTLDDFNTPKVKFRGDFAVVSVVDGTRKLRHLFLFDNALVCTKPVVTGVGTKAEVEFNVKWSQFLSEVNYFVLTRSYSKPTGGYLLMCSFLDVCLAFLYYLLLRGNAH